MEGYFTYAPIGKPADLYMAIGNETHDDLQSLKKALMRQARLLRILWLLANHLCHTTRDLAKVLMILQQI